MKMYWVGLREGGREGGREEGRRSRGQAAV